MICSDEFKRRHRLSYEEIDAAGNVSDIEWRNRYQAKAVRRIDLQAEVEEGAGGSSGERTGGVAGASPEACGKRVGEA